MNVLEFLKERRVPSVTQGNHHCREGWVQFQCPFCKGSKWHLGYRIAGDYFSCWRCGRLDYYEVIRGLTGARVPEIRQITREKVSAKVAGNTVGGILQLPKSYPLQDLKAHRKYILRQGLDPDYLSEEWAITGTKIDEHYPWSLLIPIHRDGEVLSFTTRELIDTGMRYKSARKDHEVVSAKRLIYGVDHCTHSIIIVEGPKDVWKIGKGAGATLGVVFSTAQVNTLSKFQRRIICFDADKAGETKARELADLLSPFDGETMIVHLDSKDPGKASDKEIKQLRKLLR